MTTKGTNRPKRSKNRVEWPCSALYGVSPMSHQIARAHGRYAYLYAMRHVWRAFVYTHNARERFYACDRT